jgi:hypothetical protein
MRNHLKLGDYNVLCDSCGRKFKFSVMRKRWDGLLVCHEDYELRNAQDFVRVRGDKQVVPIPRPEPNDNFIRYSCSIKEINAKADIGVADCARVGFSMAYEQDEILLNWINKDQHPAIAGLAQAGTSTAGIYKSLQVQY